MKIAVIGAGFSGMLAAYLLEKEGIEVTVFEKQEYIGGHCKTLIGKNEYTELGTTFSFSKQIKELLIELQVDYTKRLIYRNFLDENHKKVEHMHQHDVALLMTEMKQLKLILDAYSSSLKGINYGYIHEDLMIPLSEFLKLHGLKTIYQVIAPHLSSFGFGAVEDIQTYYAFRVFDIDTIYTFIKGEKLLFVDKGMSQLIDKLSQNISDIRYALEVKNIEAVENFVKVDTVFGTDYFDKVLITTKLPKNVIQDPLYNKLMKNIDTNPFFTCAYEVSNKNLVTTYYKPNLGVKNKIQFYHTTRHNSRTTLVAFAYGVMDQKLVKNITSDIEKAEINIKHLITAKQWYIFPHLNKDNLTQTFYQDINEQSHKSPIVLIGSLVTHPSLSNLYISVKKSVEDIMNEPSKS